MSGPIPTPEQWRAWGIDPEWSTVVTVDGVDGPATWHLLDTGAYVTAGADTLPTLLCVHGNPTWSYLFSGLTRQLLGRRRVVAVDQLNMGWSDRGAPRRLGQRIDDLVAFAQQHLGDAPVVLVAHDWGGPVAVGAAARLDVRALVLSNTAVTKPDGVPVPPLIATARRSVAFTCQHTPLFVAGTVAMAPRWARAALRAPYRRRDRREGIATFVADIPVRPQDPSHGALAAVADTLETLSVPTLLVWGGSDPVFHERFLDDLTRRCDAPDVERLDGAGHLAPLDARYAPVVDRWLHERADQHVAERATKARGDDELVVMGAEELDDWALRDGGGTTLVYDGPDGRLRRAELATRALRGARALRRAGLRAGDRVVLALTPSADLLCAAYAVWGAGGVVVAADQTGGLKALRRLLRAQGARYVIGTAGTLGVVAAARMCPGATMASWAQLPGVVHLGAEAPDLDSGPMNVPVRWERDDLAAVVHTSGATGPAKAVRYRAGTLTAMSEAVQSSLALAPGAAITASFGPFALLAPMLGHPFIRPAVAHDRPGDFDVDVLADVAHRARALGHPLGAAWLSPASARRIATTGESRSVPVPVVMLAGAPIDGRLVEDVRAVTGGTVRCPYGMTECLPVTDGVLDLAGSDGHDGRHGHDVGRPLPGASVVVDPLGTISGRAWGELLVAAPWLFDGYEQRWVTDTDTAVVRDKVRYHRSGDVGYLVEGVVHHLGRLAHVLRLANGPISAVTIEAPVAARLRQPVAAVGIGPADAQVCVVVVDDTDTRGRHGAIRVVRLADGQVADQVRAAAPVPVAAVLTGRLPVDHRHRSKVDRVQVAGQAAQFLAGR